MKRAAAQKIADELADKKLEADIVGLMTELRDKPDDAGVIENYRERVAGHVAAHAVVTKFISENFRD